MLNAFLTLHSQSPSSAEQARHLYTSAKEDLAQNSTNYVVAWKAGRAAFDYADTLSDKHERAQVAQAGIELCRRAIQLSSSSVTGHYYLALNLAQLAQTKKLGALRLLHEMEQELLTAAVLDPTFDRGGPDRALGMLYLEAPVFPTGIGSKSKARLRLERAVELCADYPENRLSLAEAFAKWEDFNSLELQLSEIKKVMQKAETLYPVSDWSADWVGWRSRYQKLQQLRDKLASKTKHLPSGRGVRP